MNDQTGLDQAAEPCWPFWGLLYEIERIQNLRPWDAHERIGMDYPQPDVFGRFRTSAIRSLRMLGRRSLAEIRSCASELQSEIDACIDNYIEQETENYIQNLCANGGWELGYLPPESHGTEFEIRNLIENWSSEWDDQPGLPSRDDYSDFDALRELYQYKQDESFYLGLAEPEEYEIYAVLALMKVCGSPHSKNPIAQQNHSMRATSNVVAMGNATIEAIEALEYADRLQLEAKVRKTVESEQPAILAAAVAERLRQQASKAAHARHNTNAPARNFVLREWRAHRASYDDNKTAFARDYVRRVKNEFDVTVTEKTMREVWLSDTPAARKPP